MNNADFYGLVLGTCDEALERCRRYKQRHGQDACMLDSLMRVRSEAADRLRGSTQIIDGDFYRRLNYLLIDEGLPRCQRYKRRTGSPARWEPAIVQLAAETKQRLKNLGISVVTRRPVSTAVRWDDYNSRDLATRIAVALPWLA